MPTSVERKALPITLLSGFLGSGKTTLLEHILKSDHGYKIAIIINDLASVNIDAELIMNHKVTQKEEKLIKLQNGCICCNLRGDLLEELVELTLNNEFQYIIIESSGVSEPLNVAQTFTKEFPEMLYQSTLENAADEEADDETKTKYKEDSKLLKEVVELGGLTELAVIDTTVTVIDAYNFLANFQTIDFAKDRFEIYEGQGEAERPICELMIDQIEFADVIILNKISSVKAEDAQQIRDILASLNPEAKVIATDFSKVDIREVVNTGKFDFERNTSSAGWLKGLNEIKQGIPDEHIDEYGISSFVYGSRKPFHPGRLQRLLNDKFLLLTENNASVQEGDDDESIDEYPDSEAESDKEGMEKNEDNGDKSETADDSDEEEESEGEEEADYTEEELVENKKKSVFGPVLRSKGFIWLASRMLLIGEWSSAGQMMTFSAGPPWFECLRKEDWPQDPDIVKSVKKDFKGKWGDRRQEIVFIGRSIQQSELTKALDDCLLTEKEMSEFEKIIERNSNGDQIVFEMEQELHEKFGDNLDCLVQY